jgi:bacterioferritin (cytochrome b1)
LRHSKHLRRCYAEQGINDENLKTTMESVAAELDRLTGEMTSALAASSGTYEMISFLNGALRLEYQTILEYERYVDAVDDARLAGILHELGQKEWQHARALSQKITELGGEPAFVGKQVMRPDMSAYDLLKEHYETEVQTVKYYENGHGAVRRPGVYVASR